VVGSAFGVKINIINRTAFLASLHVNGVEQITAYNFIKIANKCMSNSARSTSVGINVIQ